MSDEPDGNQDEQAIFWRLMEAAQRSFFLKIISLIGIAIMAWLIWEGVRSHDNAMQHATAWVPIGVLSVLLQAPWMFMFYRELAKK
jgi:hypothetical protein